MLLHQDTFKTMLMLGKHDPVLNYKELLKQTENTNVEIIKFPDGHMSFIENSKEFLQRIMYFIE